MHETITNLLLLHKYFISLKYTEYLVAKTEFKFKQLLIYFIFPVQLLNTHPTGYAQEKSL